MQIRIRIQLHFKVICLRPLVYTGRLSKAFDFNADPDLAFHTSADPIWIQLPKCGSMRIRIRNPGLKTNIKNYIYFYSWWRFGKKKKISLFFSYTVCRSTPEVDRRPFWHVPSLACTAPSAPWRAGRSTSPRIYRRSLSTVHVYSTLYSNPLEFRPG